MSHLTIKYDYNTVLEELVQYILFYAEHTFSPVNFFSSLQSLVL